MLMRVLGKLGVLLTIVLTATMLSAFAPPSATASAPHPAGGSAINPELSPAEIAASNPTPVYRFYKLSDGSHFFTNSERERNLVLGYPAVYRYEGIAFYSHPNQISGSSPVYRFYNFVQGVHFYTGSEQEYRSLLASARSSFRFEGVAYYALPNLTDTSAAVHRFYKFRQGVHFYTSSQAEADTLMREATDTYRYEDVAYFLPTRLSFFGMGNATTESFVLPSTLAVFRSEYSGVASRFAVTLKEAGTGATFAALENVVDSISDTAVPVGVTENRYALEIVSQGSWSITIEQPKSSAGFLAGFTGTGTTASPLFSMLEGSTAIAFSHDGSSNFNVRLIDGLGVVVGTIADGVGAVAGRAQVTVPASGTYMFGVVADGKWSIDVE